VFQDPRIINDDLWICYPGGYYTHIPPDKSDLEAIENGSPQRGFAWARDGVRRAIVASVQGVPQAGLVGWLGRVFSSSRRLRERAFFNHVPDVLIPTAPGRLRALDVGCGSGHIMMALKRVGWDVEGVEWDHESAEIAREVSGQHVCEGDFLHLDLQPNTYSLILLSHVFEHFDSPVLVLHRIRELLISGGRAVLFYPNPESLGARFFGSAWYPWEVPRHLVLPPARTLANAARSIGLFPLKVRTNCKHAAAYFAQSRKYLSGRAVIETAPDISVRDRCFAQLEGLLAHWPFHLGEEVMLVLQKR